MTYKIIEGNNIEVLKTYPDNHFDSVVTDPPYGIDFLGKDWDKDTGSIETYRECLRVLKPGGHLLAFSAARTYHHLAMTVELAGFEIRDQIMWIYSSGFPKSHDIGRKMQRQLGVKETKTINAQDMRGKDGFMLAKPHVDIEQVVPTDEEAKEWEGWGNGLKPAHEPIVMARKPVKGSIVNNVQVYGTGAINIDDCRVPWAAGEYDKEVAWESKYGKTTYIPPTYSEDDIYKQREDAKIKNQAPFIKKVPEQGRFPSNVIGEIEGYQKYFYCPKVSRKERHSGFDLTTIPTQPEGKFDRSTGLGNGNERILQKKGNNHPTVKPVELMKYLVKLVTPKGGTVLDPFNGSGSTGMACVELGYNYVGIELDSNYVDISTKRIEAHDKKHKISELFVVE
jgi:adenine-specific DNA-methyltransferase